MCAVRLAERGFDVTLIEKAAIGNGSSSRVDGVHSCTVQQSADGDRYDVFRAVFRRVS